MNPRLRSLLRGLLRAVVLILLSAALFVGWRAFLRFGPQWQESGKQGMYTFHAKLLLRQRLDFPRPAAEATLPVPPAPMTSADVQLRLMEWWDGKSWSPAALAQGEPTKQALKLRTGQLVLVGVSRVSPVETAGGEALCRIRADVRWDVPEGLQELVRVKEIVQLRLPKGLAPGQTVPITCVFARRGWRWELVSAQSPWGGELKVPARPRRAVEWFF